MMGFSDAEVLRYGTTEQKLERFEQIVNDQPDHSAEIKALEKQYEVLEEQLGFAADLLDEVKAIVAQETRATVIRQRIAVAFSNSMYEV